jgi:hypothetical protein
MENIFIQIPNAFLVEGEEKLTCEELYLYYLLCLHESKWLNRLETNIDLLSSQIYLAKNIHKNKAKIYETLMSLKQKDVIHFDDIPKTDKGNVITSSLITITKHPVSFYNNHDEKYKNGFEQIHINLFNMVSDLKHSERAKYFMVLVYIRKTKREISFDEWSSVLDVSVKTAKSLIAEMEKLKLINIIHGKYYINDNDQVRQEINQYSVNNKNAPSVSDDVAKSDIEPEPEEDEEYYHETISAFKNPTRDPNQFPEVEHYLRYLIAKERKKKGISNTLDEKLIRSAEKRIKDLGGEENNIKVKINMKQAKIELAKMKSQLEEDEHKQQEINRIEMIKNAEGLFVTRDGKDIELKDIDDLLLTDSILMVKKDYRGNRFIDVVDEIPVRNIIEGIEDRTQSSNLPDDKKHIMLENLKEIIRKNRKEFIVEFDDYRRKYIKFINQTRKYDEEWIGDIFMAFGENNIENISLSSRIRKENNKKQNVVIPKNDQDGIDIVTLFQ